MKHIATPIMFILKTIDEEEPGEEGDEEMKILKLLSVNKWERKEEKKTNH